MKLSKLAQKLQIRLINNLPGKDEQWRMRVTSDKSYNFDNTEEDAIQSAVLILLYEENGVICFTLTERTQTVEHHRGQISLPGGAREADEKLSSTAIRETQEEIGIYADDVDIIGALSPLFVPVTGFIINPFVGIINANFEPQPAPEEVETVISVHVNELLNDDNELQEKRNLRGYDMNIPYFLLSGHKVWGATAMILSEFKTVLKEAMDA
ncbi:MAG: coenzyme A pyrophosphatase [Candidatus Marinimicrobia bacterium]|jgi:8-oxo-dGTP pyrophosphatase MutT (NUDIX family)|nr:coenzyme A pyrophosphatase [Candidatus Neomarinimicrobiota bacterium]MBD73522.1 coenzyme A pyrophosphatase [Candidatus Neomarinimicrobiota bacterium]|tara:strand:+ start:428 stop:1060 length:633 start_codon:yes stop_codon:yes gene_type:complete